MLTIFCATSIIAAGSVNPAQAGKSENKEAKELRLFSQASVFLQDAIKAAEQKTGGKLLSWWLLSHKYAERLLNTFELLDSHTVYAN